MNKLNKLKEIWNFVFVKYLAGLFFIITIVSLALVIVSQTILKSDENQQLVKKVNFAQKQEFLKNLQTFGNAYVFFRETDLDSDFLKKKFFNSFQFNPSKVEKDLILPPLVLNQDDWDLNLNFLLQQRISDNKEEKKLFQNFNLKTIKKYFEDRKYWSNWKQVFSSLIAITREGSTSSLQFSIKSTINSPQFKSLIFSFLKKGFDFFVSDKFVEYLQFFKKNVLDWNYMKLLSNFIQILRIKNYQNKIQTKPLGVLINNLILAQNLKIEKDPKFQVFLKKRFGLRKINQIITELKKKNSALKNKIQNELNEYQLDREKQLNLKMREKIFQAKTRIFVKNFVSKLFFESENNNFNLTTLLLQDKEKITEIQKTNKLQLIFNHFIKNEQFEQILDLFFHLFFLDYLINQEKNIPLNFHDILDSFINFLEELDFESIQFGYFIDSFIKSFKEMLIKPIKFQGLKSQDAKKMILKWIELGLSEKNKIFQKETRIDHDDNIETSSITINDIQKVLKEENVSGSIPKESKLRWFDDLNNLEKMFKKLFEKSNIHGLIKNLLILDEENFISLTGKFIFNFLQKTKDTFFDKNKNKFKQLKHFIFNWELSELDDEKILFTPEKQDREKKLKENIGKKIENFIIQKNSLTVTESGHFQKLITSQGQEEKWDHDFASKLINRDLVKLFELVIDWMKFSWNNFFVVLPFFDLNIFIFAFFQFFSTNSDLAKKISFFDDLGNKKFISGVLNTLFELSASFLKAIKETDIDWQTEFSTKKYIVSKERSGFLTSTIWSITDYVVLKYLIWRLGYLKIDFSKISSSLFFDFFFQDKKNDKILELQNFSSQKELFQTDSFLKRFIKILSDSDQLTENEKQFLIFVETKLNGETSIFNQIIANIDQYLDENFYSYLNWNNWKYENIQIENFDNFIAQKNTLPLKINYISVFERSGFKKVRHHFSWEIYNQDNERRVKLLSLERV